MWNRARAALEEARAMGVSTNYSAWFSGTASTAVLTPQQVAAVAPLVRVTAAYVVMYYAFCFFQSWSKLYLSAPRRPSLFSVRRLVLLRLVLGETLYVDAWWRRFLWRAPRRWRTEFGIARSGLLRHPIRHRRDSCHRRNAGGGQCPRTPTARGRRSCS